MQTRQAKLKHWNLVNAKLGWIICALSTIGFPEYLYKFTQNSLGAEFVRNNLEFSRWFLNDYIVAVLVAVNILGFASISSLIRVNNKISRLIRYFAGMTFTLYLFHYPLLQLFGSIFSTSIIIVVLSLASVMLIAPVTEGQKTYWLRLINRIHSQLRKPLHNGY